MTSRPIFVKSLSLLRTDSSVFRAIMWQVLPPKSSEPLFPVKFRIRGIVYYFRMP